MEKVYILVTDWAMNGDSDIEYEAFANIEDAKAKLRSNYEADKEEAERRYEDGLEADIDSAGMNYEIYVYGDWNDYHINGYIVEKEVE